MYNYVYGHLEVWTVGRFILEWVLFNLYILYL